MIPVALFRSLYLFVFRIANLLMSGIDVVFRFIVFNLFTFNDWTYSFLSNKFSNISIKYAFYSLIYIINIGYSIIQNLFLLPRVLIKSTCSSLYFIYWNLLFALTLTIRSLKMLLLALLGLVKVLIQDWLFLVSTLLLKSILIELHAWVFKGLINRLLIFERYLVFNLKMTEILICLKVLLDFRFFWLIRNEWIAYLGFIGFLYVSTLPISFIFIFCSAEWIFFVVKVFLFLFRTYTSFLS